MRPISSLLRIISIVIALRVSGIIAPPAVPPRSLAAAGQVFLPMLSRYAITRSDLVDLSTEAFLGPVGDMARVSDAQVYLAMGRFVVMAEIQLDQTLLPLGRSPLLESEIIHLGAIGTKALVFTRDRRMVVIDFALPGSASIVWEESLAYTFTQFIQEGRWLFAFGTPRDIVIYDLNEPQHPKEAAILDLGCQGFGGIALDSGHLVAGCRGLSIIDVANPAQPQVVGHIGDGNIFDAPIVIHRIAFYYGQLGGPTSRVNGWITVDLADPTRPAYLDTPPPREVQVGVSVGEALYVVNDGIDIYAADPVLQPRFVRHADLPSGRRQKVDTNRLFYQDRMTSILDVNDVFHPEILAQFEVANVAIELPNRIDGRQVYMQDGDKSCRIEVDPLPLWPARCQQPDPYFGMQMVDGQLGFTFQQGSLTAFDLRAPVAPRILWSIALTDPLDAYDVARNGRYFVFMLRRGRWPSAEFTLLLIEASGERKGQLVGRWRSSRPWIFGVVLAHDGTAFVGHANGIDAIDLSSMRPGERSVSLPTGSKVRQLRREGNSLYALGTQDDGTSLIWVIDIADPARPSLLYPVSVPGMPGEMEVIGDVAYVHLDHVLAIDLKPSPLSGRVLGSLGRPDAPWCTTRCWRAIRRAGDRLLLQDTELGLWIVRPRRVP